MYLAIHFVKICNSQVQSIFQMKKMIEVLNQVGLGKLLEKEQGLDIWLGDGGRPLSGGEQRRLGLARILLNDAPIFIIR